jgi:hypothetical protein
LYRKHSIIRCVLLVALLVPAIRWLGLAGAAGSVLLSTFLFTSAMQRDMGRIAGFSAQEYWSPCLKGLLAALPLVCVVLVFRICDLQSRAAEWIELCSASAVCLLTWAALANKYLLPLRHGLMLERDGAQQGVGAGQGGQPVPARMQTDASAAEGNVDHPMAIIPNNQGVP